MAASEPEEQPAERAVHGLDLAEHDHVGGLRRLVRGVIDDLLHVGRDAAEIAPLRGGVNLNHRLDVVVGVDRRHRHALDVGDGAENLRLCSNRGDRQILQRIERIHLILRRLHHDRVVHAVVRIEPESRLHLARLPARLTTRLLVTSRSVMPTYCARVRSTSTLKPGLAERLVDARVDQAGNVPQPAQQILRVGEVLLELRAADLHLDRRRRAEIQDLADDVGRQEREGHAGEARRQYFAQRADVGCGRAVVLAQSDLDVAVLRTDRSGVVVGHVDAADRHADIVDQAFQFVRRYDLADGLFDFGELPRASPRRGCRQARARA